MPFEEALKSLHALAAPCDLVGFIDLDAELMLTKFSPAPVRQERLDALAHAAAAAFAEPEGAPAAASDAAILMVGDRQFVFVRNVEEPGEALVCDCPASAQVAAVEAAARAALARLHDPQ